MAVYVAIMRPLGPKAVLSKVMASLGVLLVLVSAATLVWGSTPIQVASDLPTGQLRLGSVVVGQDRIWLFAIAVAVTVVLWLVSGRTTVGVAVRANAENRAASSSLGWSPDVLGALTWGVGAALAALAGILLAPLISISVDQMPLLVIPVTAAALLGRFESFPLTLLAAVVIGMAQSVLGNYVSLSGAPQAIPFVLVIFILLARRSRVSRTRSDERLPSLGRGVTSWRWRGAWIAAAVALVWFAPPDLLGPLTIWLGWSLVALSLVVLLGYTGQLSLAQFAIAGVGALIAARLTVIGWPLPLAAVAAVLGSAVVGMVFAIPALRRQGVELAIITLGLATVVSGVVFANWGGQTSGIDVGLPSIFGWRIDTLFHPTRYAYVGLAILVFWMLAVGRLRRSVGGLRLGAIRANERAASALGVNVVLAKVYSFGVASAIAASGGIVLAFSATNIVFDSFAPIQSVNAAAYTVIGGPGYLSGAPVGTTLADGGLGTWVFGTLFPSLDTSWLGLIGGVALIATVVLQPNGVVQHWVKLAHSRRGGNGVSPGAGRLARDIEFVSDTDVTELPAGAVLTVDELVVRYGAGLTAVDSVSLSVGPGEIVGLIGPNGAGKTTFIDAISGFIDETAGEIRLDQHRLDALPAYRRARLGIARSFQSLELFTDSSVAENLSVAADSGASRLYLTGLFRRQRLRLGHMARCVIDEVGLHEDLATNVGDLSYGRRRLVSLARTFAREPSIALLDEPAAGLSDEEAAELGRVIRRVADEFRVGVLLVEHNMSLVMAVCDRVVVLYHGQKLREGTPAQIRADPAVIEAYLGHSVTGEPLTATEPLP